MAALDLFFSYSHHDEALRAGLETHLALLKREGLIRTWHDRRVAPGGDWQNEIDEHIESANLILLLISADFIASPYCYDIEMKRALERHDAGEARVIPVILRPCDWKSAPLGKLQALPSEGKPVTSWDDQDEAFTDIAKGLRRVIEELQPWHELDEAYERRAELHLAGGDTTEVDTKILEIKRRQRQGGQLRPGDAFGDGRYKLQKLLGQGGFAQVWRAYDRVRRELVAIKILHSQYAQDRSRRDRFFRGARKMASLRDVPGVVDILEREGHDDGFHYYVMEFVSGGDFRAAVRAGRLSIEERLGIILAIGETLQVAHGRGLIHRDVKPANILLDGKSRPKLTDFDLVRAADTTGGTRTSKLGTFLYAAPEAMMDASRATEAVDVYGLAMTAIFAFHGADLTVEVYFEQEEFLAGLAVGESVRTALARGVARRVEQRSATVEELCGALRVGPEGRLEPTVEKSPGRGTSAESGDVAEVGSESSSAWGWREATILGALILFSAMGFFFESVRDWPEMKGSEKWLSAKSQDLELEGPENVEILATAVQATRALDSAERDLLEAEVLEENQDYPEAMGRHPDLKQTLETCRQYLADSRSALEAAKREPTRTTYIDAKVLAERASRDLRRYREEVLKALLEVSAERNQQRRFRPLNRRNCLPVQGAPPVAERALVVREVTYWKTCQI